LGTATFEIDEQRAPRGRNAMAQGNALGI